MQTSFDKQLARLHTAGYPSSVVGAVSKTLLQKVKGKRHAPRPDQKRGKPAVVPYVHKLSHNLKKVATRFGVPVVFSAPRKLAGLCPRISRVDKKSGCQKKHTRQYVKCATGVIYEIPLKCGKTYVGQTGRCVNDRAREHELSVINNGNAHLPAHCTVCMEGRCQPLLREIKILGRSGDTLARELLEAYHIKKRGTSCISDTSVFLFENELQLLKTSLDSL